MSAVYWRLGLSCSTERKQVRGSRILAPSGLFNKAYSFYMAHNRLLNNEGNIKSQVQGHEDSTQCSLGGLYHCCICGIAAGSLSVVLILVSLNGHHND